MTNIAKLVVILGPTASGKSAMALELAQKFNGEIVCADSRTIYKGMDIGTAKPSIQEQQLVRHHLIDIVEPDRPFSAAQFKQAAQDAIANIQSRGKLPFLVGGSGMYIDSVIYDYGFRDEVSDEEKTLIENMSLEQLQKLAQQKFPAEFLKIDSKNRRRVEQLICKGPTKDNDRKSSIVDSLVLGLDIEKPLLRQNIEQRTKSMLSNSFVQEVEGLRKKYGDSDALVRTTGYAQVIEFLDGYIKKSELSDDIVTATWQLSRKQMTWFRRNKSIEWISSIDQASAMISDYLEDLRAPALIQ